MRSQLRFLALIVLVALFGSICHAATITGTVKGLDGAPFQGAFVEAQNTKTKMNFIVLSDSHGQYRIEKIPAGEYRLMIRAVGLSSDPQTGVNLTADQNASYDFALKNGMVRWSDISQSQAKELWPPAKGKDLIVKNCSICHGFESLMAAVRRDEDGWKDRVQYMRTVMHYGLYNLTDQEADDIATYLTSLFGPDSVLPKSPADMPKYKDTLRPFSTDAMNIVYVEYDMPGPSRMPFSAAPDKDGNL
jgi:mono/diheme cytochrome c family protein